MPGTLSFDVARWNHARSGDILVSANWTRDSNDAGFAGKTTQEGVAGHGTSSPYDIHNTLIAAGPDFRENATSEIPTGNVDLAPTLLQLLGVPVPPTMTGRVIREGLREGPTVSSVRVEHVVETVKTPDGAYELTAHTAIVDGHRYLDSPRSSGVSGVFESLWAPVRSSWSSVLGPSCVPGAHVQEPVPRIADHVNDGLRTDQELRPRDQGPANTSSSVHPRWGRKLTALWRPSAAGRSRAGRGDESRRRRSPTRCRSRFPS